MKDLDCRRMLRSGRLKGKNRMGYAQTEWAYKGLRVINTVNYVGDYKDFGGALNGS